MVTRVFKRLQQAKRVDTGEVVTVVEILPLGLKVFYRIEYESGELSLVPDATLRELQLSARSN